LRDFHQYLEISLPAEDMRPLIRLESVSKVFQTDDMETHALIDTHIEIERGEYVAISGPSGCGKSTLLAILGLLDTPSSGSYLLNGVSVHELGGAQRARIRNREIGFIFQAFNLIGDLTVAQNVELPLIYRGSDGGLSKSERRNQVQEALEQVGIAHRLNHYPAQLSGGQQQRVAVARALAGKPSILLADEPTGNLDSRNGEAVMELLDKLHRSGSTICMVTHDQRFAKVARRGIYMFDGRIVDEDALDSLRLNEASRMEQKYTAARVPECV
jgi:putative ABC transport system ATP-binding protein